MRLQLKINKYKVKLLKERPPHTHTHTHTEVKKLAQGDSWYWRNQDLNLGVLVLESLLLQLQSMKLCQVYNVRIRRDSYLV